MFLLGLHVFSLTESQSTIAGDTKIFIWELELPLLTDEFIKQGIY